MEFLVYFYKKSLKSLKIGKVSRGGRNFLGRICIHHRGNGSKRSYRLVDFFRRVNCLGLFVRLCIDCNRSALLALIFYYNGICSFIVASESIASVVFSGSLGSLPESVESYGSILGWALPLRSIKLFSTINMVERIPRKGSVLIRSAGSSGVLIGRVDGIATIKLNSCWQVLVKEDSMASLGLVSNGDLKFSSIGSAGKARGLGFRPVVRGVAKNPCDHPHGGGNGKKSKKPCPVNRYGFPAIGKVTKGRKFELKKRRLFKKI
jgi:large subunit ribosomal protein L2